MYEAFFGLQRPPFANVPDPELVYLSPQHKRALAMLEYAILSRGGFCVLTGGVGTGKTTLVRRVLQGLDRGFEVGLVTNTQCDSFEELLQWILLAFGLEYRGKQKVEMHDVFVTFLIDQFKRGVPVTLIVDEAQHLGPAHLEQLRMLSNVNTEKGQVLQTILIGQPELWDLLRRPELSQFSQRVSYDCYLGPLESVEDTWEYVEFRLGKAGGTIETFALEGFPRIFEATGGVPRLINLVCDTALLYAYAERLPVVTARIIEDVLRDKETGFAGINSRFNGRQLGVAEVLDPPGRRSDAAARNSSIERAIAKLHKPAS